MARQSWPAQDVELECRAWQGWTSRLCGKQSCWAEAITAQMIPKNADQVLQFTLLQLKEEAEK